MNTGIFDSSILSQKPSFTWYGMVYNMKKLLNLGLLLTSLFGYLEWGTDQQAFLFQVEMELLLKIGNDIKAFLHPFILIPLAGQLMILYSLFQRTPGRKLSLIGLACLSTIMLLLFFIGLITLNIKILLSALPFIITGIFVLRYNWKRKTKG